MARKELLYCLTVRSTKSDDKEVVNFTKKTLPPSSKRAKVKRLAVDWDFNANELPAQIAEFPAVEYLSVPGPLVHTLTSAMAPPTLRMLQVISDETSKCALGPALQLPQLTQLVGFSRLAFRADQIPNVHGLEVKIATPKMPAEIAKLPLRELGIGPLSDRKLLSSFAKMALVKLEILGGNVTSLAGIEMFSKLEELGVKRLTKLCDVSALAKLTGLRVLTLQWCPKLAKIDAVGRLPKLKVVDFRASKVPVPAWKKLEPILEKRKIAVGNLPDNIEDLLDEEEDDAD